MLAFAGSVLTARSLAARDRQDLDANREFVGLGAANIAAGFFQGFPVNGSDSRSFLAANSGGRSQAVGLTSAVLVLSRCSSSRRCSRTCPTPRWARS